MYRIQKANDDDDGDDDGDDDDDDDDDHCLAFEFDLCESRLYWFQTQALTSLTASFMKCFLLMNGAQLSMYSRTQLLQKLLNIPCMFCFNAAF